MLPSAIREKFAEFGLDQQQINTILDEPKMAELTLYVTEAHDQKTAKTIANWCLGELQRLYIEGKITWDQVSSSLEQLVKLAAMIDCGKISSSAAKELLNDIVSKNIDPEKLAIDRKLIQVSDENELVLIIEQVLSENQKAADDVRKGEMKAIGFLVGQVMKASKGSANPGIVQDLIKKQLGV